MNDEQIIVHNNTDAHRYEAWLDGHLAILTYALHGEQITFLHTGVPAALEGRGVGNKLARTALDDSRTRGLAVVPLCPFVAAYIRRHPEYIAILAPTEQTHFQ